MKLAIVGTRGIPARYGGFETFAEELSVRLAARGHKLTVYCRSRYAQNDRGDYRGVARVVLPAWPHKYLDTVTHSCISALHGLFCGYDAVLMCNAINAIFSWIPRVASQKVALNVDGVERQRGKWNRLGKFAYLVSEKLATRFPHALVTDAQVIHGYYLECYGADSVVIPYGAPLISIPPGQGLSRWDLKSRGYILYVSRLEPENHAHTVIAGFQKTSASVPLVVVGDAPYSRDYIAGLHRQDATADGKVIFTGAVYGDVLEELLSNALLYVQATEVGGTHPALLQAMGAGNIVIANDTPEHHEVLQDAGLYYRRNDAEDLARKMEEVVMAPAAFEPMRNAARQRVGSEYCWDKVTDRYEELFRELVGE
jgi:glycosyltransferase involved in cell wall biosynthesis